MSETEPLVSIVIPVKNRVSLLKETINSIIAQTYSNWEVLIIDDNSTSPVFEIANEFSKDPRIQYHKRNGAIGGAQVCRNQGIKLAGGKYILLFDSDDLLAEFCLEKRVEYLKQKPNLDFVVFTTIIFGWEFPDYDTYWNCPNDQDDISRFLNWDTPWQTGSVLWKSSALRSIYPFSETTLSFQDIEIHIKALASGLEYEFSAASQHEDNFHREHEGIRIGHNIDNIEHLKSHESLLDSFYQIFTKKNILTTARKISLSGFYFRICTFWIQKSNISQALKLWKKTSEYGIINLYDYYTSIFFFIYLYINKSESIPFLTRLRSVFLRVLPIDFFSTNNTWKQIKKS